MWGLLRTNHTPPCGDVPERYGELCNKKLSNLLLEVLSSNCVSLSNQNIIKSLVVYGFWTIAVCRKDLLEEMSQRQWSSGDESIA